MKLFGNKNWSSLWKKLEQTGNVGLDYAINPFLYPKLCNYLHKIEGATIVDFGAGTNILSIQFLFGYQENIDALKLCKNLELARENVKKIIGLEQSSDLVGEGKKYLSDLGFPDKVEIKKMLIGENKLPFKDNFFDLAISRNFLMHLSIDELSFHLSEARRILKKDGHYLITILNPEYELKKYKEVHDSNLNNGQLYSFSHGAKGENGIFYHYFKSVSQYESIFKKDFSIISKTPCVPITSQFKKEYPRYYWKNCPMAFVYDLKKF